MKIKNYFSKKIFIFVFAILIMFIFTGSVNAECTSGGRVYNDGLIFEDGQYKIVNYSFNRGFCNKHTYPVNIIEPVNGIIRYSSSTYSHFSNVYSGVYPGNDLEGRFVDGVDVSLVKTDGKIVLTHKYDSSTPVYNDSFYYDYQQNNEYFCGSNTNGTNGTNVTSNGSIYTFTCEIKSDTIFEGGRAGYYNDYVTIAQACSTGYIWGLGNGKGYLLHMSSSGSSNSWGEGVYINGAQCYDMGLLNKDYFFQGRNANGINTDDANKITYEEVCNTGLVNKINGLAYVCIKKGYITPSIVSNSDTNTNIGINVDFNLTCQSGNCQIDLSSNTQEFNENVLSCDSKDIRYDVVNSNQLELYNGDYNGYTYDGRIHIEKNYGEIKSTKTYPGGYYSVDFVSNVNARFAYLSSYVLNTERSSCKDKCTGAFSSEVSAANGFKVNLDKIFADKLFLSDGTDNYKSSVSMSRVVDEDDESVTELSKFRSGSIEKNASVTTGVRYCFGDAGYSGTYHGTYVSGEKCSDYSSFRNYSDLFNNSDVTEKKVCIAHSVFYEYADEACQGNNTGVYNCTSGDGLTTNYGKVCFTVKSSNLKLVYDKEYTSVLYSQSVKYNIDNEIIISQRFPAIRAKILGDTITPGEYYYFIKSDESSNFGARKCILNITGSGNWMESLKFRIVDSMEKGNNLFPNGRQPGKNWQGYDLEIASKKNNKPMYTIKLTSSAMKKIANNTTLKDYVGWGNKIDSSYNPINDGVYNWNGDYIWNYNDFVSKTGASIIRNDDIIKKRNKELVENGFNTYY